MAFVDLPIEFYSELSEGNDGLQEMAETRILELAAEHNDIGSAAVAVETVANTATGDPLVYRARVAVYMRPDDLSASKEGESPEGALKAALSAVERQVRERRKKLGQPWKRADLPGAPGRNNSDLGSPNLGGQELDAQDLGPEELGSQ